MFLLTLYYYNNFNFTTENWRKNMFQKFLAWLKKPPSWNTSMLLWGITLYVLCSRFFKFKPGNIACLILIAVGLLFTLKELIEVLKANE